jgi:hypothetical protein
METVYKRASARRDLVEDYVYLAGHAGIETAERFLSSAGASFTDLARNPNGRVLARSAAGRAAQVADQRI